MLISIIGSIQQYSHYSAIIFTCQRVYCVTCTLSQSQRFLEIQFNIALTETVAAADNTCRVFIHPHW